MTAKVTILGPNLHDQSQGSFHVHAADCADVRKRKYAGVDGGWVIEASSVQEIVEEVYGDIIYGDNAGDPVYGVWTAYADDVNVFPCVKF